MSLGADLLIAVAVAFAFSLGAHYTGACMGMPRAAGAIRVGPALLLMAPLTLIGAVFASGGVEGTVGHGILASADVPIGLAVAIVASALALTTAFNLLRIPTSTIQILVFSAVGAGTAAGVPIHWGTIETLLALWAIAPFAAFALGFAIVRLADRARPTAPGGGGLARSAGLTLVAVGAAASFAMGANDVANASGAFIMTGLFGLTVAGLIGGIGLAVGVLTWGRPLLERVAFQIVTLDPRMATAAQFAQALVVLLYVAFGYFTSLNQALVGAMLGVGQARRQAERTPVVWTTVRGILAGWVIGPLSGGVLGAVASLAALHLSF